MHSAVCRQKQCNKIFSVYWYKFPPRHLWSFALKSLKTFHFELLLSKRRYAEEIQKTTVNSRDLWQVTSATSKLSWKQAGGLGNSSQPYNIEFQRTEGRRSIVICLNSVSIQRSALCFIPDIRLLRRKGGVWTWDTRTAQKLTWIWASAGRDGTELLFRSTSDSKSPDERSKMREWSFCRGVEGNKQSVSICQVCSRSAFLKFQTLRLNFKGNKDPEVKEGLF